MSISQLKKIKVYITIGLLLSPGILHGTEEPGRIFMKSRITVKVKCTIELNTGEVDEYIHTYNTLSTANSIGYYYFEPNFFLFDRSYELNEVSKITMEIINNPLSYDSEYIYIYRTR